MKPKDGDISTSTPYLGVPAHQANLPWSARERERVTIDLWGTSIKERIFCLARVEEVGILLNADGEDIGVYCASNTKHLFQATRDELIDDVPSKDALAAYLQHNSVFSVLKKGCFTNWHTKTILRTRKDGDQVHHGRKEAERKALVTWKSFDKDIRGYLRNMDKEQLLSFVDSVEELRISIIEKIK